MFNTVVTQIDPGLYTFSQAFTAQTTVTVSHSLGYYPLVQVINGSLAVLDAEVTHTDVNTFVVVFAVAQTGTILFK